MKIGTTTHPKFRRLMRILDLPQYAVVGLLESLWMMAAQFAEDGNMSRFCAQDIADYCGYEGDADSLLNSLVDCRFLDQNGDNLLIHDWLDHRPGYLNDRARKRSVAADSGEPPGDSRKFQESPGDSAPAKPSQAKPSPTNSSLGKPSQAHTNGAAGSLAAEFLKAGNRQEVLEAAEKLRKVCGGMGKHEVWQLAWISHCIDRGLPADLVDRITHAKEPIRNKRRYLHTVLRRELEPLGVDLGDCFPLLPEPKPREPAGAVE